MNRVTLVDMVVISAPKYWNKLNNQGTNLALPNNTMGGVFCESNLCRCKVPILLVGNSKIIGLVYPNDNSKKNIYIIIGGSWSTIGLSFSFSFGPVSKVPTLTHYGMVWFHNRA